MQSKAATPEEYLAFLPEDRRGPVTELRKRILENLPEGFEEGIAYGMLGYCVPLSIYPAGYHCNPKQPLPFISLASQKGHISFHHMGLYEGALLDWFTEEWSKVSAKKLDMGKCCVRFKKPEDIPYDLMGKLCNKITPQQWISYYEDMLGSRK